MIYAWRYPQRVHRSVMLGVNPPGHFLWDARTTGDQIRTYAALCAHDASCRARTPDLAASLHAAYAHMPHRFWFLPISAGDAKAAGFFGLMNATAEGDPVISSPKTLDTLVAASKGDGSGAWFLALLARLAFPRAQVWGDVAAVAGSDIGYARRFFASHADRGSVIGSPGTDLIWVGGKLVGKWPSNPDNNEYTHVQDSNVPTLLIGGNLDFATPAQNATRDLLPHLRNGHQVVLKDLGHTDDFWTYEPAASTHLVNTFLDTGRVDTTLYTPHRIDFTPTVSHGDIAKIIVTVALAFAALSALSLVLMARRVRRRGRLGRKTGVLVRSVYVLVLGFGGWFGGVLIALAALPTVPLDDALLIGLSVAVPVGLGVGLAWVDRDMAPRVRWIGFAAATSCAFVGAWLGFNAMGSLYGIITALVGAAAGANLGVLALDLLWDRPRLHPRLNPDVSTGFRRNFGRGPVLRLSTARLFLVPTAAILVTITLLDAGLRVVALPLLVLGGLAHRLPRSVDNAAALSLSMLASVPDSSPAPGRLSLQAPSISRRRALSRLGRESWALLQPSVDEPRAHGRRSDPGLLLRHLPDAARR
jgi:hypothetical protein